MKPGLQVSDTSGVNFQVFSEGSFSDMSGLVWLKAQKREAEVSVVFCGKTDTVATLEGPVRCDVFGKQKSATVPERVQDVQGCGKVLPSQASGG